MTKTLSDIAKRYKLVIEVSEKIGYENATVFEPDDGKVTAMTQYSEDMYVFDEDAPITFESNGRFTITTSPEDGEEAEEVEFIAYLRADWSKELTT